MFSPQDSHGKHATPWSNQSTKSSYWTWHNGNTVFLPTRWPEGEAARQLKGGQKGTTHMIHELCQWSLAAVRRSSKIPISSRSVICQSLTTYVHGIVWQCMDRMWGPLTMICPLAKTKKWPDLQYPRSLSRGSSIHVPQQRLHSFILNRASSAWTNWKPEKYGAEILSSLAFPHYLLKYCCNGCHSCVHQLLTCKSSLHVSQQLLFLKSVV